jgi:hypothetical protein
MQDDNSTSLVNLGGLSKPADTLVRKVSSAVGGLFEPWQIERVAKAQAKAELIKAQSEIEISGLQRRAMYRFVEEEAQRQLNMESITQRALPHLEDNSDPGQMADDWITNFFDKCRIVSDDDMQEIWSKVLAGEANAPGTYSKRTVNFLGDLDKDDAELFQSLCRYGWIFGSFTPLIFKWEDEIYTKNGLNFTSLSHLDSIGLIQFQPLSGFRRAELPETFAISYCGNRLDLVISDTTGKTLPIGQVLLTKVGLQLALVCNSPGVDGFFEYVCKQLNPFLPSQIESEQAAGGDG